MAAEDLLTYRQLADRVERALGVRPALSSLRAAAATAGRGVARTRLTAGLPAPTSTTDATGQRLFLAAEVDAWLAGHPRRRIADHQRDLAAAPISQRPQAVAAARAAGLSWREIADALTDADGRAYSRQWAQQRYGSGSGVRTALTQDSSAAP